MSMDKLLPKVMMFHVKHFQLYKFNQTQEKRVSSAMLCSIQVAELQQEVFIYLAISSAPYMLRQLNPR